MEDIAGKIGADRTHLEMFLRPLRREMTVEVAAALLRLRADSDLQARYEVLADRNTEGQLSAEEKEELVSLVRINLLFTLMKAEAGAFLRNPTAPA
jgi:hypothetical protein